MSAETEKTLAEEMQEVRHALGLTQLELARKLGISDRYVSQIEKGKDLSKRTATKLVTALRRITPNLNASLSSSCNVSASALDVAEAITRAMTSSSYGTRTVSTRDFSAALRFRRTIDLESFLTLAEFAESQSLPGTLTPLSAVDMSVNDFQAGMAMLNRIATDMRSLACHGEPNPSVSATESEVVEIETLREFLSLDAEWHLTVLKLAGMRYAEKSYLQAFETINLMDGGERLRIRRSLVTISECHTKATRRLITGDKQAALASLGEHDELFLDHDHHLAPIIHAAIDSSNARHHQNRILISDTSQFLSRIPHGLYLWSGLAMYLPFAQRDGVLVPRQNFELVQPLVEQSYGLRIATALRKMGTVVFFCKAASSEFHRVGEQFSNLIKSAESALLREFSNTSSVENVFLLLVESTTWEVSAEWSLSGATQLLIQIKKAMHLRNGPDAVQYEGLYHEKSELSATCSKLLETLSLLSGGPSVTPVQLLTGIAAEDQRIAASRLQMAVKRAMEVHGVSVMPPQ